MSNHINNNNNNNNNNTNTDTNNNNNNNTNTNNSEFAIPMSPDSLESTDTRELVGIIDNTLEQEFGTSNSVSSFLNDYIHRNGTQMPTSTFQLRQRIMNAGWYLPDTTLKYRMLDKGRFLNCYVCNELISFCQVGGSRTLPRESLSNVNMPLVVMENVFVLCHKCVLDTNITEAPRNYRSIIVNYRKRTDWFATLHKINMDLEQEKMTMLDREITLQRHVNQLRNEINSIQQDIVDLKTNMKIEEAKYFNYSAQLENNLTICKELIIQKDELRKSFEGDVEQLKKFTKHTMRKCNTYVEEVCGKMTDTYHKIVQDNQKDADTLDSMFNMEIIGNAPCQICRNKKISIFLNPCGHCICEGCSNRFVEENNLTCPFCKSYVVKYMKMYLGF